MFRKYIKSPSLFVLFSVGIGLMSATFAVPALAEDPNPYRLGPSLEEYEQMISSETVPGDAFKAEPLPVTQPAIVNPDVFDQQQWNKMRSDMEEKEAAPEQLEKPKVSTTTAQEPPKPPPGQIYVELPYESSLSVTGRKLIKIEIKNTHISAERASETGQAQDTQSFNMEQELQARIQGTVARKTTINVNFDDTKENVRDFSVVYKGDPDEVVQEAAFGDIVLSLPATEFVNYSKQLFGIRTTLKYKNLGFTAIGSRTKGTTETKRFTGTTKRQQVYINDTSYIRRKYYDLTFTTASAMNGNAGDPLFGHTILPMSDAPEIVYIEDTTGLLTNATSYTVAFATKPTETITLRMRVLSRGVDYNIDRLTGLITFVNTPREEERVAIDYTLADGARLSSLVAPGAVAVLIKDKTPEAPEASQEKKRFYSVGAKNIVRDNGLGNFVFKMFDKDRQTEIGPQFGSDFSYRDGEIKMNFDTGVFELLNPLPFPEVYSPNINPFSPLRAVFSVEFNALVRTFQLRPNIVLQSEKIEVDGRKVNRDLDYFIDYDIGLITFFNDDLIKESTVIEATYEYAPFGGQLGETLVGARVTYDVLQKMEAAGFKTGKWTAGSTVLYNFAAKPTAPPDIRSTPSSLLVLEADTQIKDVKIPGLPFMNNFSIEAAQSNEDPNIYGRAIVDSMEGIKQDDAAPMLRDSWQVAAPPNDPPYNTVTDFRLRDNPASHLRWDEIDVATTDPDDEDATQKALNVGYSLNTLSNANPEQVSMVNVISFAGRDFSKKNTLEVEIEGAGLNANGGQNVDVLVEYGTFNEDADGTATKNNDPKDDFGTEDRSPFDGVLSLGEDTGWTFNGPVENVVIGAGNARLDSEDLNNDRALGTNDIPVTTQPLFQLSHGYFAVGMSTPTNDLAFNGRRLFKIPINSKTLTEDEKARLLAVRQVRVTIRNTGTVAREGSFRLVRVAMVGNSWEPAALSDTISTMTVSAINNKDDSTYVSLLTNGDYLNLYRDNTPSSTAKEQALSFDYSLLAGATGYTVNKFSAPRDLSKHKHFKFFLRRVDASVSTGTFFLQAGSETDYQQVSIDVNDIPYLEWKLVDLEQLDTNSDGNPETWTTATPGVSVKLVGGAPNLTQVAQFKAGVFNNSNTTATNQIWLNEIFETESNARVGHARKYAFDSTWNGWMDFGGSYRYVDRNWRTPVTSVSNQDSSRSEGRLNITRFAFLPLNFTASKEITKTPSAFQSNNNALVSFLQEGRVETTNQTAAGKLIIPKFPTFDFGIKNNDQDNNTTLRRQVDLSWNAGVSYSIPVAPDVLPGKLLTFRPLPTTLTYTHTQVLTKLRFREYEELVKNRISTTPFDSTNLDQTTVQDEARMGFKFWNGFTFNPNYRLAVAKEKRAFRDDELQTSALEDLNQKETPRSIAQNVGASGSLKLTNWLEPTYNYSMSGTETNGLPTVNNTTAYMLKQIVRNSQAEVSASVQAQKIFKRSKLFQALTLTPSYKAENGDSYQNMPEGFSWRSQLWAGSPLALSSGTGNTAQRLSATDKRTFRFGTSWLPFTAYAFESPRAKPLSSISLTNNFSSSIERSEETGTKKKITSRTFPDAIMTINSVEDIFGQQRFVRDSRLTLKTNVRKDETHEVSKRLNESYGGDYQFKLLKKWDIATSYSQGHQRDDDLILHQLTNETNTKNYSVQTRIPKGPWAYTPRYEHSTTDSHDSIRQTNDLVTNIYSLQIYGDLTKPIGLRLGRKEFDFANRFIMNATVKWESRRSNIDPSTNYVDIYSGSMSGDYTLSKNFRLAIGGNFGQEKHHPDFRKFDQLTFGINSTLTIQF